MNIKYSETDQRDLGLIQDLWEKLNVHHEDRSRNFKKHFKNATFEARNKNLLEKLKDGKLRIDLATDTETGKPVGYCVSTIADGKGEIDSLYIEEAYRHAGIGYNLFMKAWYWLDKMQAKDIIIAVADGNEEAFGFYAKFGFYPRVTILKRVGNPQYECPCCGNITLDEKPPGTFEICPVCNWEDDFHQFDNPDYRGGANVVSLNEARSNYLKWGVSDITHIENVRPPLESEKKKA